MAAGEATATIEVKVEGPAGNVEVGYVDESDQVSSDYKKDGPLPSPSSKSITGSDTFTISYPSVGNYVYKIKQNPNGYVDHVTYDETYYLLYVMVYYDTDGSMVTALEAQTNGKPNEGEYDPSGDFSHKPKEICFTNVADKTYTVIYEDGEHGKSSNPSESGKYIGEYPKGGNVVTPNDGYKFTGTYKYRIVDDAGKVIEEGTTDDPTSIMVKGHIVFTPLYEPVVVPPSPTATPNPPKPSPTAKPGIIIPFTGDDTNLMLYGGLFGISFIVILIVLIYQRKEKIPF